jgi:uncharacterized membrane protein YccC
MFKKWPARIIHDDWLGVHFALNVALASAALWFILRLAAGLNPIWAVSSMIAASDPIVQQAAKTFRCRLTNAMVGCVVGLLFLALPGSGAWKLPLALGVTVLLSTYVVRMPLMWRQAPITAAIVIAAAVTHHSEMTALEIGVRRVGEVLLGCFVGLVISWVMSIVWPPPNPKKDAASPPPAAKQGASA